LIEGAHGLQLEKMVVSAVVEMESQAVVEICLLPAMVKKKRI
jgi:hypothetical protein